VIGCAFNLSADQRAFFRHALRMAQLKAARLAREASNAER
jgi:hypothetical protein